MDVDFKKFQKKYLLYLAIWIVGMLAGILFWSMVVDGGHPSGEGHPGLVQTFYTCSMHPAVRLEKEGACPVCGMALVPVESETATAAGAFRLAEEALALADIRTMRIAPRSSPGHTLRLSGVIRPNEKTNAIQMTLFDGRLDRLDVNFVGEKVRKGQEIGVIYAPELYLAQDQLLTSSSYKDTHVKLYQAARNSLGLWKMTDQQIEEVVETGKPMFNFPLQADVSGTVTEVIAKVGDFYKQGDPLYKLSDLSTVWAVFDAYEDQIQYLSPGQRVKIETRAYPGKAVEARISFIEPLLNRSNRTVAVRADLENGKGLFKPGMFIEGEVGVESPENALWIPKSAVLWTGKRSLAYLKQPGGNGVFEAREITLGESANDYYEVVEGLQAGDEIVVNGTFTVDAAAQLNRRKSMMRPDAPVSKDISDESIKTMPANSISEDDIRGILHSYLAIKEALVGSKPELVRKLAGDQLQLLDSFMGSGPGVKQKPFEDLRDPLTSMESTSDIKVQRQHFKPYSQLMIAIARMLQNRGQALFVQYCPMYDNNKGGFWLSSEREIANPYFGDMMLRCGSVTEVLD